MLLADKLKKGDCIGIFSPSSPATANAPTRFQRARDFLQARGFGLIQGRLTGEKDYYRSGSIKARAEELNELIRNPQVKCIMSTMGGYNSNSLLPYIDYHQLRKTPKIIIGYSDVTAILLGILAKTGLITYYGPAFVASLGEFAPLVEMTFRYFADIVVADNDAPLTLKRPEVWTDSFIDWEEQTAAKPVYDNTMTTVKGGVFQGRLIGGNLNTMQGIWGSPYMPKINDGDILFIEDSMKDIATVERSFAFLKINGVFDKIGGLILGKHEGFKDGGSGRKPCEVLLEVIGECHFPILVDFDCCHTHPMLTLPLGCIVTLDADQQTVTLMEKWIN